MAFIKTYKKYFIISALIWTACLIAFVLVYLLIINPQNKAKNNIVKKLVQSEQEYTNAQQDAKNDTQVRINEEIGTLRDKLEKFVLDPQNAADLTFDISQIANECAISSFNVQSSDMQIMRTSSDPNNILEKHIKISFIAGFQEFALFLNTLERHKPVLFVNEFMLSSQSNEKTSYQVILDLTALVQKKPAETQKAVAETMVGLNF